MCLIYYINSKRWIFLWMLDVTYCYTCIFTTKIISGLALYGIPKLRKSFPKRLLESVMFGNSFWNNVPTENNTSWKKCKRFPLTVSSRGKHMYFSYISWWCLTCLKNSTLIRISIHVTLYRSDYELGSAICKHCR